jgi:hypothetical protein
MSICLSSLGVLANPSLGIAPNSSDLLAEGSVLFLSSILSLHRPRHLVVLDMAPLRVAPEHPAVAVLL